MKHKISKKKKDFLLSLADTKKISEQNYLDNLTLAMCFGEEVELANFEIYESDYGMRYPRLHFSVSLKNYSCELAIAYQIPKKFEAHYYGVTFCSGKVFYLTEKISDRYFDKQLEKYFIKPEAEPYYCMTQLYNPFSDEQKTFYTSYKPENNWRDVNSPDRSVLITKESYLKLMNSLIKTDERKIDYVICSSTNELIRRDEITSHKELKKILER